MKVKSESEAAQLLRFLATSWTAAYLAPLSVGFSRQPTGVGCYCLLRIAMARTSKTVLNENGMSRPPRVVPDLRGNAFHFSPLSMMLALALSYMRVCHAWSFEWVCPICPVEMCSLCAHFLKSFLKMTNEC